MVAELVVMLKNFASETAHQIIILLKRELPHMNYQLNLVGEKKKKPTDIPARILQFRISYQCKSGKLGRTAWGKKPV